MSLTPSMVDSASPMLVQTSPFAGRSIKHLFVTLHYAMRSARHRDDVSREVGIGFYASSMTD